MADQGTRSYGPFAVFLMALHDREFMERLLTDPRKAMTDLVKQGKLTLTDADVAEVMTQCASSGRRPTPAEGLAMWDHWHQTGQIQRDIGWTRRPWPQFEP